MKVQETSSLKYVNGPGRGRTVPCTRSIERCGDLPGRDWRTNHCADNFTGDH